MVKAYIAPTLSAALTEFKKIVASSGIDGRSAVVFCEDRLSLVAERALCEAAGGSFSVSVYTLSRFLAAERGRAENLLTSQGSAMALRYIIDENAAKLNLFKKLSATGAAQQIYDTIALLYSSGISSEDVASAEAGGELLRRKLSDLALLYSEYERYLAENDLVDRNAYLRRLPEVIASSPKIKGAKVIILGFQAFTSSVRECVRACIGAAESVDGLFVGGEGAFYFNQAWASFVGIAAECKKPASIVNLPSDRIGAAEHLRRNLFDTYAFHRAEVMPTEDVTVTVAADEREECEYIASRIVGLVSGGGVRYREISVMLPDIPTYQPALERAFRSYGIPLYADRRYPLSSHPACAFLLSYLACLADGCRLQSVAEVVSSPVFLAACGEDARRDKDNFINYLLRAASGRGGVKRQINTKLCEAAGLDAQAVDRVRSRFLGGLSRLAAGRGTAVLDALVALADDFALADTLALAAEDEALEAFPSVAAMNGRAYEAIMTVIGEARRLSGQNMPQRKLISVLKSGFAAAEISLIPPKQDAVFVGDLSKTVNTGSKYVFVAGLTDAVPASSQDTAILTDAELRSLEGINLAVSPKISEVNDRLREITALNLCAFSRGLYLITPLKSGGEERAPSEVVDYACRLFSRGGGNLSPVPADFGDGNFTQSPQYFSRPLPALRRLAFYMGGESRSASSARDIPIDKYSAVSRALSDYAEKSGDGYISAALGSVLGEKSAKLPLTDGRGLYGSSLSPTALENYFACPYKCFMSQGLRLAERAEGELRPLDSGNFIHEVLQSSANALNTFSSEDECAEYAEKIARDLIAKPEYSALGGDKRGQYTAAALIAEARRVTVGAYRQLANSLFKVDGAERDFRIPLGQTVLRGRIDRVDTCGDLVRIIDYKTGSTDDSASAYYMGLKTQLPLYLRAAAEGKRAVGAYYFPAKVEYGAESSLNFCLQGFMDSSEEVVRSSDTAVKEKERSAFVNAYLNGRKIDKAMDREEFSDFLDYSVMVVGGGAEEMYGGNISPSPAEGVCKYCKFGGCCGFDLRKQGERPTVKVDCRGVAEVARRQKEGKK